MSTFMPLYNLLQQRSGEVIGNFTPVIGFRVLHNLENIVYGDIVTTQLMADVRNRQEKLNSALLAWEEAEKIMPIISIYSINSLTSGSITRNFKLVLVYEDDEGTILGEGDMSFAFAGKQATGDSATIPVFEVNIEANYKYNYIYIYRSNTASTSDPCYLDSKIQITGKINTIHHFVATVPFGTDIDTGNKQNEPKDFETIKNYVTLPLSRIQAGEDVDGLQELIQTNEDDLEERVNVISDFLNKR